MSKVILSPPTLTDLDDVKRLLRALILLDLWQAAAELQSAAGSWFAMAKAALPLINTPPWASTKEDALLRPQEPPAFSWDERDWSLPNDFLGLS
jgi:hypothetical protein